MLEVIINATKFFEPSERKAMYVRRYMFSPINLIIRLRRLEDVGTAGSSEVSVRE